MAEMVATEREYVRALDYTIQNYFPELDRPDVPQGLRGQRAHLFGNLEKLRDFHYNFFLRELEACTRHPPRVAHAFLRHVSSIGHRNPRDLDTHLVSGSLHRVVCHTECCGGKQTAIA